MPTSRRAARAPTSRRAARALVAALLLASAPAAAAPASLDSKRREAARLTDQIERQGELLSRATEDYNESALRRERVEGRLARVRRDLAAAEERWDGLRSQLGQRVRYLYMHPGAWAADWLSGASSFNEFARARVFAGTVMTTDTDLLLATDRARAEMMAKRKDMEVARTEARGEERSIGTRRAQVLSALASQRALLSKVQGEIAQLVEQERRRRVEQASRSKGSGGVPAPRNVGPVRPSASRAIATAAAQIGKPYEWGAAGPGSYDCSGLTMYAWASAGVSMPHSSRAQYAALPHVPNDQIQPGDLLFYGSPIHHVGMYEGGGVMIHAPETGENVERASIYRRGYAGGARP